MEMEVSGHDASPVPTLLLEKEHPATVG